MCQIHVNIANSLCEGQLGDEFEVVLDLAGNQSCAMVFFVDGGCAGGRQNKNLGEKQERWAILCLKTSPSENLFSQLIIIITARQTEGG